MNTRARKEFILNELSVKGRVFVLDLSEQMNVSIETARRDIKALSDENLLKRIHGGAVKTTSAFEASFKERLSTNLNKKKAIGLKAKELLHPGLSLFIDCGSTTLAFASTLNDIENLTVITNSPRIAKSVWEANNSTKIYMLGGEYRGETFQNIGGRVIRQIEEFNTDIAIIGAGGISLTDGISASSIEEAEIAKAMINNSESNIVLADKSKLNNKSLCKIAGLDKIDNIIIDNISESQVNEFKSRNINVINIKI
ncbi:HTH-type transcriptional repressor glcR [Anaerobiospirillum thomasii]|uniref:HTH-type transcriptional repressor glcR n=1 Tax=Anaerobiospirillum thomasii TaxID=179995 RepID=A0A2X0V911_9GAMM|nr:DeoR/GlpR family DNA-binding transcription regulator [Anaerobiospirillum thomasii]SPT68448.1 HTH-type transcriptional repressor glcR [Anaerobiospirillum thomasii]SPT70954.1 HTH-type transcriptional repressor glcR [Anaerobiospirillum thomasii]